jgi:heme exporter protein A
LATNGTDLLEAQGLECVRGERTLFSGLRVALRAGELLRIAGPNGSGKTSLLRILCGLLAPTQGAVRWRGENIHTLREDFWREMVYIGHASAVKDDLTAAENLIIACALQGTRVAERSAGEALRSLGLAGCEDLPARVLSQGQRRRVVLARLALSESLPLWILDEPFTALDAAAVEQMQLTLSRHLKRGAMVVYTTHQDARIDATVSRLIELGSGAPT